MKIRSKVVLFALFFAWVSGSVGAWCFLNIRREEAAFADSRRAMKTHAAVTDIEYFLVRQVRALENYVLLNDEAEKLQLAQAAAQTRQRLAQWEKSAKAREAQGEEIPAVRKVNDAIAEPAKNIEDLLEAGRRSEAMGAVEKEFSPAAVKALAVFSVVKGRTEAEKERTERRMLAELRRNHLSLLGGLGLVAFLGLVFLFALYRSVISPIRELRSWADRVARGEKGQALQFSGGNELTELARSIGEMAIQLTRPKASPPPVEIPESTKGPGPVQSAPPTVPSAPSAAPSAGLRGQAAGQRAEGTAAPSSAGLRGQAAGQRAEGTAAPSSAGLRGQAAGQRAEGTAAPSTAMGGQGAGRAPGPVTAQGKDEFDSAVNAFRDILAQMGGDVPESRRLE
ncbi:MAG: HAMP domain-containing protein [Elusimicrobia bacterium]|nr:HAMP domain-containing protein [Elusimicrobiota bacterium]